MRALDGTAADVEWRANPFANSERLHSNGCANDVHHGIDRAHLVEVHLLDGNIVNLRFRLAQSLENANCSRLRGSADLRTRDDLADLGQTSTMYVWRGHSCPRRPMLMRMRMLMLVRLVRVRMTLLLPELFSRHIFFAMRPHIGLDGSNPIADDSRDLESRADIECRDSVFQQRRRHSGVDQRAKEHVAADPGKAVEVGNPHRRNGS